MNAIVKHSRLGASKAEQFIACSAAPQLVSLVHPVEDADEPDYRRDGTAAHAVAAECLRTGLDPWNMIGDPRYPLFDKEHVDAVQSYLDFVRERSAGAELLVEQYVDDPDFEEFGGTLDAAWVCAAPGLAIGAYVVDYKHGVGLAVDAYKNPQLLYYALGMLIEHPELEWMTLVIVQPRAWHSLGPIRDYHVSAQEVLQWAERVLHPAMRKAQDSGARFVPGSHCRFCPVKLACPALVGMVRAVAHAPVVGSILPQEMTDEQLGAEGAMVKPAEMYFRAVMSEIARRQFAGRQILGWKVVAKRADRVWVDPLEAERDANATWLTEAFEPSEFKSPAQIDKLPGGKEFTAKRAHSPQTGYTIAPDEDRRKAVSVTAIPQALLDKAIDER